MALPTLSCTLVILFTTMAIASSSGQSYYISECGSVPSSTITSTKFRANLKSLLAALPPAAAQTGFASLRSGGTGGDRVFARGLCFGDSPPSKQCLGCLSDEAERVGDTCQGSPRAGIWTDGCFLAYADTNTNTSSASEDTNCSTIFPGGDGEAYPAFVERQELVDLAQSLVRRAATTSPRGTPAPATVTANTSTRANGTVLAVAQCARDRAEADCVRCLQNSVRVVRESGWGRVDGTHAGVAAVLCYNCYLRFEISPPTMMPVGKEERLRKMIKHNIVTVAVCIVTVIVIIVGAAAVMLKLKTRKVQAAPRLNS